MENISMSFCPDPVGMLVSYVNNGLNSLYFIALHKIALFMNKLLSMELAWEIIYISFCCESSPCSFHAFKILRYSG